MIDTKICLLTGMMSTKAGGLSSSVPSLAHSLAKLPGHDIRVFGLEDPDDPTAANTWGPETLAHTMFGPSVIRYSPSLIKNLEGFSPDIVDVQGIWIYPSLANLKYHRRTKTPYIVTPHGMLDPWAVQHSRWKKRMASLLFECAHLKGASCLRATADMEAQNFREYGLRQPIAIVSNSVDVPATISNKKKTGPKRALFLSRIHKKKGLPFLLKAWQQLADKHSDWEIVITGPDENGHLAELKMLERKLGVPRIKWREPVHGEEKVALFESADLFVLPTHAENFGLVVAESLAHGVPVITTKNAPWAGLKTNGCGWWIDLDLAKLRGAMDTAMSQPRNKLSDMGRAGHLWMKRDFGAAPVAEQMSELYDWAINGGSPPNFVQMA